MKRRLLKSDIWLFFILTIPPVQIFNELDVLVFMELLILLGLGLTVVFGKLSLPISAIIIVSGIVYFMLIIVIISVDINVSQCNTNLSHIMRPIVEPKHILCQFNVRPVLRLCSGDYRIYDGHYPALCMFMDNISAREPQTLLCDLHGGFLHLVWF